MKKVKPLELSSIDESEHGMFGEEGEESEDPDEHSLSYEVVKTGDELEAYIDDIADTVRIGLDQSIAILTPWFFNNMPRIYYQTTPRQEKVRHLSAIITGHVFETKQTVELWDRDRSKVTFIGPGGDRKILLDMATKLQNIPTLKMGALYFSRDKLLFLSTFFCSDMRPLELSNDRIAEKIKAAKKLMLDEFADSEELIDRYIENLDNDFVIYATAARLHITFRMVHYMDSHEGALTFVEPIENSPKARLTLGIKNVAPAEIMESIINLLHRYDYNVVRAFVIKFADGYDDAITVMHFIIENAKGEKIEMSEISMRKLTKALRTLGWIDVDGYSRFSLAPHNISVNAANLVRGLANWTHIALAKFNPHIYSLDKIEKVSFYYSSITLEVIELFRIRFDNLREADRQAGGYAKQKDHILELIEESVVEEVDRHIFKEFINFIDHILKTNYFLSSKTGLAFRMSPEVLNKEFYPNSPFGFFYIIGRGFRAFQVRWKDISRGGMRVVMPRNHGDYNYALLGLFDEVYGLSHAQQLKNKDIPEGGSKAVLLLENGANRDQAVKGAVNALLDLLVTEDESHQSKTAELVEYYNKEEIIYLGPDENMTNELIKWVTNHSSRRGYPYARAFMSSKPGDGINHKEYGVTSEGVNVFVDNLLRFMGINPRKEEFRVKMTGGPDGDVAGNELLILNREYGTNARIVSIADGFGAAADPEGLSWKELLRLVKENKSIAEFSADQLSGKEGSFVVKADSNQNIRIRDELTARTEAEIFIPAGGRPYTVNGKNWNAFIGEDGKATMRAVVEGANIFFTAGARENLQKAGVLIVKDSSANKTGVICSSYEIIACLTLESAEFKEIKEQYVKEVIDILQSKADAEAKLLLRFYNQHRGEKTLVDLSMDISMEINEVTDCLLDELTRRKEDVLADEMFQNLIYLHCPPILCARYKDRILERLPDAHKIAILAAYIASYIVYREGLGWLHGIPEEQRFKMAVSYMTKDLQAANMVADIMKSSLPKKDEIAQILGRSGARHLAMLEFESEQQDDTDS